jgi:superfamily II DNA or RNA helicase
MKISNLLPNVIVKSTLFPEEVQVITTILLGSSLKLIGKGLKTGKLYEPIIDDDLMSKIEISQDFEFYDGDSNKLRLVIEALRLGLAYEYDPFFSLSIARVDTLPHQLEAVYEYFLKLPRIRFLLADDPGAGKTIMAGLLIKELKIRGLVERVLIVAPANLTFQWQRELKEKFREKFDIVKGDVLRANYGSNPFKESNYVITSISWISRVEDANESLLRSSWDLIIVDEAHKMSAYSSDRTTLAYDLGKKLSELTSHYLLMTATPHKGDPENFRLFLELLDKDVYGEVKSINEAMYRKEAPFYLRRVKEALVSFPDPETGIVKQLFTKRNVSTANFTLTLEEMDFYYDLTNYVEDQSIKASSDDSARGRALGFTMAMLQRRFASSTYAVRRSLERMKEKREIILADPDSYRQEMMKKKYPDDFDDLTEEEQIEIMNQLEDVVASIDPVQLKNEIIILAKLINEAKLIEQKEIETKLVKLKEVITEKGIFSDPKMKLLIFTEHKDTLDYLCGDGKDGRPYGKLKEWGLNVTKIHGGMKIGDRDTPNTRIFAERDFKENAQILVATEAAGEGINLQFCWFMINYDIPWNPVRLEQRMGRIHRYGQEKDCLIINFVSTNTREGRVLDKLFERIKEIETTLDPNKTGQVFNVLGDVFPSNLLEKMLRDMYAKNNMTEQLIKDRIVKDIDVEKFKKITNSTLEGLAKRELNLSAIYSKASEAKERRLVPEVIEDFFLLASKYNNISSKGTRSENHIYRIGKVPRNLWAIGEKFEMKFGKLGKEYAKITFDKKYLPDDPTLEWVTPGHPLFESVREDIIQRFSEELRKGAFFYDINLVNPVRLDVFTASIHDGRANVLHRRLYVTDTDINGVITIRQPTVFLDLIPAINTVTLPDGSNLPDKYKLEQFLIDNPLKVLLEEIKSNRSKEISTIKNHVQISLNELINHESIRFAELHEKILKGDSSQGTKQSFNNSEERLETLNYRLEKRLLELEMEINCTISDIQHIGSAWVVPHPEKETPEIRKMVRDDVVEKTAVEFVTKFEENRGWIVKSVESDDKGFDLISRHPHPEDPQTAIDVRFIEVKGRAGIGDIALTSNEYKTAERLAKDYWLYVVYNCAGKPELKVIQDPARLGWNPIVKIEHYFINSEKILRS